VFAKVIRAINAVPIAPTRLRSFLVVEPSFAAPQACRLRWLSVTFSFTEKLVKAGGWIVGLSVALFVGLTHRIVSRFPAR
jgi:hypothetical protein